MRRFFTYLVLYGLVVVSGVGVAGLLGQLLDRGRLVAATPEESARNAAFVAVGLPLAVALAVWVRRSVVRDARERESLVWAGYLTVASLTALIVAMTAAHDTLAWAVGVEPYSGHALGRLVVWSGLWGCHWWVDLRLTPDGHSLPHLLAGSLAGLATATMGFVGLLAGVLVQVLGLAGQALVPTGDRILRGAVTFVVGACVWLVYWARTAVRRERSPLWTAYVLLAGIGGSAVLGLIGAGRTLFDALVWLAGRPETTQAAIHFRSAPTALAAAAAGLTVWTYHRAVLGESGRHPRTDVRRVFEYLMAGIGLLTGAAGAVLLIVGVDDTVTRSASLAGTPAVNVVLGGATLLVVGASVWGWQWHRTQAILRTAPQDEAAATARRIYLLLLTGVGVLVALGALLTGVFLAFSDALAGGLALETMRRIRYPIALLLVAGVVAAYHALVYRRERAVAQAAAHHPQFVLLVGPDDPDLARAVARDVGGRVRSWPRTDRADATWSAADVTALVRAADADNVVVVSDADGLHAIPVDRH
jgi:hypothetical protein